jgi:hypothetical protein
MRWGVGLWLQQVHSKIMAHKPNSPTPTAFGNLMGNLIELRNKTKYDLIYIKKEKPNTIWIGKSNYVQLNSVVYNVYTTLQKHIS